MSERVICRIEGSTHFPPSGGVIDIGSGACPVCGKGRSICICGDPPSKHHDDREPACACGCRKYRPLDGGEDEQDTASVLGYLVDQPRLLAEASDEPEDER